MCTCARHLVLAALLVSFVLLYASAVPNRNYNVTFNSVSGLDLPPSKDLALDPRFNLTLRLASGNPFCHECMDADTCVQVSNRYVPLAASAAASHRLCMGPKKSTDVPLVAKGTGVRLPGFLMDSLAADMLSGTAAFEVRLRHSGGDWVASCGARQVGDGGAGCGDGGWDMRTTATCAPRASRAADNELGGDVRFVGSVVVVGPPRCPHGQLS